MAFASSDPPREPGLEPLDEPRAEPPGDALPAPVANPVRETVRKSVKILVVGGFGVGKTTLIGSVSEIAPLRTEEPITTASVGVDDLALLEHKTTTTVAMDFGRITLSDRVVLFLFGAPGQQRFWRFWQNLATGALGALVLVDTRRLEQSFDAIDQLEESYPWMPLAVAVNHFPDSHPYPHTELRQALDLRDGTPLIDCDARDRDSSARALITLVEHVRRRTTTTPGAAPEAPSAVPTR